MKEVIKRFEKMGQVQALIDELFHHEIFKNLSKHNPYWDSEHEIDSEKLYDIRCKLGYIHDRLSDALALFSWDENDNL